MPWVQYVDEVKGINVSNGMPTPRRMTEIRWWLKTAQLFCREIPRAIAESSDMVSQLSVDHDTDPLWFVQNIDVSERWVKFNIENRWGSKAHIVIDRKREQFSGKVKA